jgi:hypothetical protein
MADNSGVESISLLKAKHFCSSLSGNIFFYDVLMVIGFIISCTFSLSCMAFNSINLFHNWCYQLDGMRKLFHDGSLSYELNFTCSVLIAAESVSQALVFIVIHCMYREK